ncbi:hypothetical protein H310_02044 [Aphanomyces invadans]|uniref:Uncharacterized protein n=1 Tax=Aphanomyces invadans TaxID=157072 RepID=A0A024UNY6_9STRA|nr:hypothetical protein H310_02044 [Aphanomyces invadans]ETW07557.1 hypothetical protein H310_02044 [Aphanomyces invadans]|eukprot:XP_008863650.1 hypothetical protein H310_02044 [Aphanomyces invadans]
MLVGQLYKCLLVWLDKLLDYRQASDGLHSTLAELLKFLREGIQVM